MPSVSHSQGGKWRGPRGSVTRGPPAGASHNTIQVVSERPRDPPRGLRDLTRGAVGVGRAPKDTVDRALDRDLPRAVEGVATLTHKASDQAVRVRGGELGSERLHRRDYAPSVSHSQHPKQDSDGEGVAGAPRTRTLDRGPWIGVGPRACARRALRTCTDRPKSARRARRSRGARSGPRGRSRDGPPEHTRRTAASCARAPSVGPRGHTLGRRSAPRRRPRAGAVRSAHRAAQRGRRGPPRVRGRGHSGA